MIKILLLTHIDSDNLGDQLIEICDVALLHTVMKNLGYTESDYEILSEKAAAIPPKYMQTRDPNLIKGAKKMVRDADIVMLGGAPQFNYLYQYFSERSVLFCKFAKKFNKPIIFSAIGIENYDPTHPKCQKLKRALAYDCVKMVTTRDNLPDLKRLVTKKNVITAQVADPAVVTAQVMRNCRSARTNKIGLVMIRGNAFIDNGIDFSGEDLAKMWVDLIQEIQQRGYDYELITSGHYADEQYMDMLVRWWGVKLKKCVFNTYTPDQLVNKLSSYAGVVTCRLHPSIISYSLKVPSVGIVWNPKVEGFYKAVNYQDRIICVDECSPKHIMDKLEAAMAEGVSQDPEFVCSIYNSLFTVMKQQFCPDNDAVAYDYEKLMQELPAYAGTTPEESHTKLVQQSRRCYKNFNKLEQKHKNLGRELDFYKTKFDLTKHPLSIKYFTPGGAEVVCQYNEADGEKTLFAGTGCEYTAPSMLFHNNGKDKAHKISYQRNGYRFLGWYVRVRSYDTWFWLMADKTLCMRENTLWANMRTNRYLVKDMEEIPVIPLKAINAIVLEACWGKECLPSGTAT